MGEEAFEDGRDESTRRWYDAIEWGGLLALGFALYEITNQPALGTAVLCLKFGWQDFKTARWLWRNDPWRLRGDACGLLYLGSAFWRAACVAALTNVVILVGVLVFAVRVRRQAMGGGDVRLFMSFVGATLITVIGYLFAALFAAAAVRIAHKHGIRLWLSGSVNAARRWGTWPPPDTRRPQRNLLLTVLSTSILPVGLGAVAIEYAFLLSWGVPLPDIVAACSGGLVLVLSFVVCMVIGQTVEAPTPSACWPPDELAAWPDDPLQ
jgi:hypothetical protein